MVEDANTYVFARCTNPGCTGLRQPPTCTQNRRKDGNKQLMNEGKKQSIITTIHSHFLLGLCFPTFQNSPTILSHYPLRVHALISSSFLPLLLPPPSPCSPALNGLIHLLISSTITHLWTEPKHLAPDSLHSAIPFSEHVQIFCH